MLRIAWLNELLLTDPILMNLYYLNKKSYMCEELIKFYIIIIS